jgi:NhaP-type Na+/H+ and K+/H+ antiporter
VSAYRTDWPAFCSNSAVDTPCSRIVGRDAGVVSLAAALALPSKFPARDVIVFLAFCSIFATLIVQGTTLGWLVRKLEVIEPEQVSAEPAEALARVEIADAALETVKEHLEPRADSQHTVAVAALVNEYEARAERAAEEKEAESPENAEQFYAERRLRLVAIEAARDKLLEHTDQVDTDTHRSLAEELNLEEQQIRSAMTKSGSFKIDDSFAPKVINRLPIFSIGKLFQIVKSEINCDLD